MKLRICASGACRAASWTKKRDIEPPTASNQVERSFRVPPWTGGSPCFRGRISAAPRHASVQTHRPPRVGPPRPSSGSRTSGRAPCLQEARGESQFEDSSKPSLWRSIMPGLIPAPSSPGRRDLPSRPPRSSGRLPRQLRCTNCSKAQELRGEVWLRLQWPTGSRCSAACTESIGTASSLSATAPAEPWSNRSPG